MKKLWAIIKAFNRINFFEFYRNTLGWYFAIVQITDKDGKSGRSFFTLVYVKSYSRFVFYKFIKLPLV